MFFHFLNFRGMQKIKQDVVNIVCISDTRKRARVRILHDGYENFFQPFPQLNLPSVFYITLYFFVVFFYEHFVEFHIRIFDDSKSALLLFKMEFRIVHSSLKS